jgi:hypothetical protein
MGMIARRLFDEGRELELLHSPPAIGHTFKMMNYRIGFFNLFYVSQKSQQLLDCGLACEE